MGLVSVLDFGEREEGRDTVAVPRFLAVCHTVMIRGTGDIRRGRPVGNTRDSKSPTSG